MIRRESINRKLHVNISRLATMAQKKKNALITIQNEDDDDVVQIKSSQTSSLDTSITSGEDFAYNPSAFQLKLTVPDFMKKKESKSIGQYVKVNENGWLEEKKLMNLVSPDE